MKFTSRNPKHATAILFSISQFKRVDVFLSNYIKYTTNNTSKLYLLSFYRIIPFCMSGLDSLCWLVR